MHGLALALLAVASAAPPVELPPDVTEIQTQECRFTLRLGPGRKAEVTQVRLFVSADRGETWKHHKDYKPTDEEMAFRAPRDGVYWFACQVVLKDGTSVPSGKEDLAPSAKV